MSGTGAYLTCDMHDEPLIREAGGTDMPTIHGRLYCPKCQASLVRGLNDSAAGRTVDLGSFEQYADHDAPGRGDSAASS